MTYQADQCIDVCGQGCCVVGQDDDMPRGPGYVVVAPMFTIKNDIRCHDRPGARHAHCINGRDAYDWRYAPQTEELVAHDAECRFFRYVRREILNAPGPDGPPGPVADVSGDPEPDAGTH